MTALVEDVLGTYLEMVILLVMLLEKTYKGYNLSLYEGGCLTYSSAAAKERK